MLWIGSAQQPKLPVGRDSNEPANHAYSKLIGNENWPSTYREGDGTSHGAAKSVDFCVDASTAILRSGVHYSDKTDTLDEWKLPVTIIGSHDCRLLFFEPMVSWKWISKSTIYQAHWPKFEVSGIVFSKDKVHPVPSKWSVEVSDGCRTSGIFTTETL
jgi:hypothetical protein